MNNLCITGIFTAPVKGAYHFEIHIYGIGGKLANAASLVHNGRHVVMAYTHQTSGGAKASNGVSLALDKGDVVFVRIWLQAKIFDNLHHHNTFSGHLLFKM